MAAVVADEVVVNLRANTAQYNANVAQSEARFTAAMGAMARSAAWMVGGGAVAYGVMMLNRNFRALANEAIVVSNSLKIAGLSGEEFVSVQKQIYEIAIRQAAPVKDLAQVYGRMAQAQKELGASTSEMLGVTNTVAMALRVSGRSADEARGALLQLSQAFGAGIVRGEEWNAIAEGMLPLAQAAAAGLEEAGGSVAKLRRLVIDGKISSEVFFRAIEAGAYTVEEKLGGATLTTAQAYTQLRNATVQTVGAFDELTGITDGVVAAMSAVADGVEWLGKRINDLTAGKNKFIEFFEDIRAKADEVREAIGLEAFFRKFGLGLMGGIYNQQDPTKAPTTGWGATTRRAPISMRDYASPDGDKKGRENAFARQTRQLEERTKMLQLEAQTLGQTQRERDTATAQLELENAAIQARIALTPEVRAGILATADAYARAAEEVRKAEEVQRGWIALQEEFGNAAIDALDGLISGTKSLNDVLSQTLRNLAKMAAQAAILGQGPLAGIFGTSGGGGNAVGGIIGSLFGGFGGFRASGGPVSGGRPYVVGERGPEMFVPGSNGMIVPNSAFSQGTPQSGTNIVLNNDFRDSSATAIAALNAKIDGLERRLPAIIQQTQQRQRANQPFYGG